MNKRTCVVWLSVAVAGAFVTGCESTTTTVVDARSGRPLAGTRVTESDGTVRYTDAQGSTERTAGTTARVTRSGYRSVDMDR
ncbi:MAG: hypothetical protein QOE70_444 [Chthoniobacter sp.]|jgi:hypothetical protein|nr:hypothetical protein [Chthoniobacter sp.]